VQQALNAWIDGLTQVLTEAELDSEQARKRAEDAVMQIQGALVPTRALGDTLFERVLQLPSLWMLFASTGDVVDLWLIALTFNGTKCSVEYSKLCYRKRVYLRSQVRRSHSLGTSVATI